MASKKTNNPTKVLLTEATQGMVEDCRARDAEAGKPTLSDRQYANWLIQLGHASATDPKRKAVKR